MATIWRGGCIIRARFLDRIKEAYERDAKLDNLLLDDYFLQAVVKAESAWRQVIALAVAEWRADAGLLLVARLLRRPQTRPRPGEPAAGPARLFRRPHLPTPRQGGQLPYPLEPGRQRSEGVNGVTAASRIFDFDGRLDVVRQGRFVLEHLCDFRRIAARGLPVRFAALEKNDGVAQNCSRYGLRLRYPPPSPRRASRLGPGDHRDSERRRREPRGTNPGRRGADDPCSVRRRVSALAIPATLADVKPGSFVGVASACRARETNSRRWRCISFRGDAGDRRGPPPPVRPRAWQQHDQRQDHRARVTRRAGRSSPSPTRAASRPSSSIPRRRSTHRAGRANRPQTGRRDHRSGAKAGRRLDPRCPYPGR